MSEQCDAEATAIYPTEPAGGWMWSRVAVFLSSSQKTDFGGEIAIVSGRRRYVARFGLIGRDEWGAVKPIIVQLPEAIDVEAATLTTMWDADEKVTHCSELYAVFRSPGGQARFNGPAKIREQAFGADVLRRWSKAMRTHDLTEPTCAKPYEEAKAAVMAPVVVPASAKIARESGIVRVLVSLRSDGTAERAQIYRSSGFRDLDAAALESAKSSTFVTERFRCAPTSGGGQYLFVIQFTP